MRTLLSRFLGAAFAVPLLISRPFLFWLAARERRTGAWRQRQTERPLDTRPEPAIRALQATPEAVAAMADALRRVLAEDDSLPRVYPHLARFQRRFAKHGLEALQRLPVDQLRRGLSEFEALVRNWSSASLADLRSRMAVVLADRSSAASMWIAANSVGPHAPRPGSMDGVRARNGGAARRPVPPGGRQPHLGMSRFGLDGGFRSTSAPA